jgi:A/G-specific adenine glycosylase
MASSPRRKLLAWYLRNARDLPWRRTSDPWRILLSEVMLQQTRVTTVIPYYEKFVARFPTAQAMAEASEEEVLALWAGLGYYSRARNLRKAAQAIAKAGAFPSAYEEIRALPGIGDYTAAAVASICFDLPRVVVDGNVLRVMSRLLADSGDLRSTATRERLREAAQAFLDPKRPADFNQALMELGATVCLPRNPLCLGCPAAHACEARKRGIQSQLPVKERNPQPHRVELHLFFIEWDGAILLRRRPDDESRMPGFWELPDASLVPKAQVVETIGAFRHGITNHDYFVEVSRARLQRAPAGLHWKRWTELGPLPVTTMTKKAFRLAQAGLSVSE